MIGQEQFLVFSWTILSIAGLFQAWWVNRRYKRAEQYRKLFNRYYNHIIEYRITAKYILKLDKFTPEWNMTKGRLQHLHQLATKMEYKMQEYDL